MNRWGWFALFGVPMALAAAGTAWWLTGAAARVADPPALTDRSNVDPDVLTLFDQTRSQVRDHPKEAELRGRLGMVCQANALLEPAVTCYEQALELDNSNAPTWYRLALARADLGNLIGAIDAGRRAAALDSTYAPVHWRLGSWLMDLQRLDEAEAEFKRVLQISPADSRGAIGLARIALQRGELDRAVQIVQEVLKRNPNNGLARQLLGSAYRSLHKFDEARAQLIRALGPGSSERDPWADDVRRMRPGYRPIIEDTQVLLSMGRGGEALQAMQDLRRKRPGDIPLLVTLSAVFEQMKQPDRAMETMQDALARDPNHFAVHLNLANLYALKGQRDQAMAHVARSIELNPWVAKAYVLKAQLLVQSGKPEEAIESLRQALRLGGPEFNACLMLAGLLADRGKLDEAVAGFQQAQRLNPDDPGLGALGARLRQLQSAAGARTAP